MTLTAPSPTTDFDELAKLAEAVQANPSDATSPAEAVPGHVYQTTDYDRFCIMKQNRVVSVGHVRKLVGLISKRNLLHMVPILVTEELEVIDGQHRLAAARELGVPIYYQINDLSGDDIAMLNSASKNWVGADYLHYWAALGEPDYKALAAFMNRHPVISFSNAKTMLQATTTVKMEEFKKGFWRMGDVAHAEQAAVLVERIGHETSFKRAKDTLFVMAVHHCITAVEGFHSEKFMKQILMQPTSLEPCISHKKYLEMFDRIYNYRTNADNRLRFL